MVDLKSTKVRVCYFVLAFGAAGCCYSTHTEEAKCSAVHRLEVLQGKKESGGCACGLTNSWKRGLVVCAIVLVGVIVLLSWNFIRN